MHKKRKPLLEGLTIDRELANCYILSSSVTRFICGNVQIDLFLFFYLLLPFGAGHPGTISAHRVVQTEHGPSDEAVELQ